MKSEKEVKLAKEHQISRKYWIEEHGFSEYEYEQVIKQCEASNFGFCESCMDAMHCELKFTH